MRVPRLFAVITLLLLSPGALAYEGAGRVREDETEQPPPPPKLTKAPTIKKAVEAPYPPELLKTVPLPSGSVKLLIDIGADGHVPRATISQSSGYPAMDESALTAIKQFEFTPAEMDGKPAAIRLEYVFNFKPPPPPPPPPPDTPPPPAQLNFRGRVLERGTRDPLADATVYLPDLKVHTETDASGAFEFRGVPLGINRVEVTQQTHAKFFTKEDIKPDKQTEATYYLWKKVEGEYEATVQGEREKKDVSEHVFQKEELTSVPGTFGDPIRVVMNMPGLTILPYGAGALLVRGSSPGDTQTLMDGVPIPILFHFAGGPSVVNPSFIDKVDFFPGAYGAKYGRAIAGIVDVETAPPSPKAIHGDFDVDLIQSNFYLEGPISSTHNYGSWEIAARRSYIDTYLPLILPLVVTPGQAAIEALPVYWDYQTRYDIKIGKHQFEASVFGSDDQIAVAQVGTVQAQGWSVYEHQGFHKLRLKWTMKDDGWTVFVAPSGGYTINSFNYSSQISGSLNAWEYNVRAGASKKFLKSLSFDSGLEFNGDYTDVAFNAPVNPDYVQFPGENPNLPYAKVNSTIPVNTQAIYAELTWSPFGGLKLIPGFRAELYQLPSGTSLSPEPRVTARYEFPTKTTIKFGWGFFAEPPPIQDLAITKYTNGGSTTPKLGLQHSQQTVVGVEQQITSTLSIDLEGYYTWRYGLAVVSSSESSAIQAINSGRGYTYGMEVLIRQEVTKRMFGWIAYTLSRTVQSDAYGDPYVLSPFDETHILTIVASYKFDWGIQTGVRFRYATGTPTTPIANVTFDSDTQAYNAGYGATNSARQPDFQQLDVRVEKLWTFQLWTLSLFLDVQNIYNAVNPATVLYSYNYSQTAVVRGLPILPTLGIAGHF